RRGVPNGTIRNQMFRAFPKKPYRQRSKIESVFSAVKRKLSSRAPGRSLATQVRQALLLGLAYNIYRLWHRCVHGACQQSLCVAFKRLTQYLNPLDATHTKTRGWGQHATSTVFQPLFTTSSAGPYPPAPRYRGFPWLR